ncbi:2-hydroxycarboxylate transporter family protein [Alkalicoccobacillus murimartini]|uniref:Malate:Na+ symporter n=1 Tax=Alkalicoccobacillus murimartini TaxID=171685 RepID=A0ABT9YKV0_9BACI|nr:malate:Na+ symporter [Alkalicoccobacillus murimartini]
MAMPSENVSNMNNQDPNNNGIWAKIMEIKVGVLPLPLYIFIAAAVFLAAYFNELPSDMIGGFAVIMVIGMLLGDIGLKTPILKDIGGPAILSLLLPSVAVFLGWFNAPAIDAVDTLMSTSNFLYAYIAVLVVGSILGMSRVVLLQGFARMFIPLVAGTLSAIAAGLIVGSLFGYELYHTFFFIIVPIISGGIGEGILPLSISYATMIDQPSTELLAQLVPAAIIGNIVAIICAGMMKKLGEKRPDLNGNGVLVRAKGANDVFTEKQKEAPVDFRLMGAGVLVACTFFIFGGVLEGWVGISGAVLMIVLAALVKVLNIMPAQMELGSHQLYKFVSSSFTWPLMVGLGIMFIPLESVAAVFSISYVIICASVVLAMVGCGFFVGKLMNMYPIEAAIVTGCHSGLGGTGDVAILSASNRMGLMPFAQISTRLGGAATVIGATLLMRFFVG